MQPSGVAVSGAIILGLLATTSSAALEAVAPAPLLLEAKIPLGNIQGRIDHLAVDIVRRHACSSLAHQSLRANPQQSGCYFHAHSI